MRDHVGYQMKSVFGDVKFMLLKNVVVIQSEQNKPIVVNGVLCTVRCEFKNTDKGFVLGSYTDCRLSRYAPGTDKHMDFVTANAHKKAADTLLEEWNKIVNPQLLKLAEIQESKNDLDELIGEIKAIRETLKEMECKRIDLLRHILELEDNLHK